MRLLIVLPEQQESTGNYVTAHRLQTGLQSLGFTVKLLALKLDSADELSTAIDCFDPDHLLLLHAWRSGKPWLESPRARNCPTAVLLTGTDINHGIDDPQQGPVITAVLEQAAAIVSQNRLTVTDLQKQAPSWVERLHYIPAGVLLGTTPYRLRKKHHIPEQARVFLHPAGIRPVKANLELLKLCDPLAAANPNLVLAFCGPDLDHDYFRSLMNAIEERPWALYLGIIPADAMPSAMLEVDLILNHSVSEGMSNALLEANAVGCPVIARDIPGNAAVPNMNNNFRFYNSDQQFLSMAQTFLDTPFCSESRQPAETPSTSTAVESKLFADMLQTLPIGAA